MGRTWLNSNQVLVLGTVVRTSSFFFLVFPNHPQTTSASGKHSWKLGLLSCIMYHILSPLRWFLCFSGSKSVLTLYKFSMLLCSSSSTSTSNIYWLIKMHTEPGVIWKSIEVSYEYMSLSKLYQTKQRWTRAFVSNHFCVIQDDKPRKPFLFTENTTTVSGVRRVFDPLGPHERMVKRRNRSCCKGVASFHDLWSLTPKPLLSRVW